MRVIITAGGTGGHIYPALSILNKIKEMEPDSEFLYIGTHNRMEKDIVPKAGYDYYPIKIYGIQKYVEYLWQDIQDIYLIPAAYLKAKKKIKEFKPDVVIGVGGYVTYPVIKAAHKLGIPTFIHEQNSIPGKSNRTLAKYTNTVGISFPDSAKYFENVKIVLTGNPVASNALSIAKQDKTKYGLSKNKKSVLICAGSLGSDEMNKRIVPYLDSIKDEDYEVLFTTGKNYFDQYKDHKFPDNVKVVPYVDNLSGLMKDIDLIISRAGASTVSELEALGLPNILIPSPWVANNHQYYNALSMQNEKASIMIQEKEITPELLREKVNLALNDKELRKEMKENLKKLAKVDSADIIYKELKVLVK